MATPKTKSRRPLNGDVLQAAVPTEQEPTSGDILTLVSPKVKDRWLGMVRRDYTASTVRAILDSTNYGSPLYQQMGMFEMMEESWPRLGKNLHEVRNAVARADWVVQPWCRKGEKPTPSAYEKARFVEDAIFSMRAKNEEGQSGIVDTIYDLADAYGKGLSVLEIDWQRKPDGSLVPDGTRWIRPNYYDYPTNPEAKDSLMLAPTGKPMESLVNFHPNKFIIGLHRFRSSNLAGRVALLRTLAPWWVFGNFATEWLLQFGQIFGIPLRWANYRNKGDLPVIQNMLENMGAAAWGAFPEGTNITLHETGKATADNPNAYVLERADILADLVVLGQTLTSQADAAGANRALGEVHERVLTGRTRHVAVWAGETLTNQLSAAICRLNYGNEEEVPQIMPRIESVKDPKAQAERDKLLFVEMKLPVAKSYLYEQHGVPQPGPDDELYEAPEPPQPIAGPNMPGAPKDAGQAAQRREAALSAVEAIPGIREETVSALESLPDDLFFQCADDLIAAGEGKKPRYRKGQKGGGRFMSKEVEDAIHEVREVMEKWPSEGQHRARRHIKAFGLPDNEAEFRSYLKPGMADMVDQRVREVKKLDDVELGKLKTTQSNLDAEKVIAMLMSTADDSTQLVTAPIVIKRSNKLWLWDGHHRAAKCAALKKKTIKARVVDTEDL